MRARYGRNHKRHADREGTEADPPALDLLVESMGVALDDFDPGRREGSEHLRLGLCSVFGEQRPRPGDVLVEEDGVSPDSTADRRAEGDIGQCSNDRLGMPGGEKRCCRPCISDENRCLSVDPRCGVELRCQASVTSLLISSTVSAWRLRSSDFLSLMFDFSPAPSAVLERLCPPPSHQPGPPWRTP